MISRLTTRKSTKDLPGLTPDNVAWPSEPDEYTIGEDIGRGVSATVHIAKCLANGQTVAVKRMNLDALSTNLEEIIQEAKTMRQYNHPNVLPMHTSFVWDQELWMVMPYCPGGSVLHIMKYKHPEGLSEVIIATICREVLKALEYVHKQGGIHRDIKCGNILIDNQGMVKLGDFGVSATSVRGVSWGHDNKARMTFVGTPCWMAPEVMEQSQGYGTAADIWSLGITLLEMAYGHAPFAKYPPMKILLMTLQNAPPTLEDSSKKQFSKSLKDVVARCLQKEPDKRPTAAELLQHKFFKLARDEDFVRTELLVGLPSLGQRVIQIRQGQAATSAADNDERLQKSQEEYQKGVTAWNFDVASLKAQAEYGDTGLAAISEMEELAAAVAPLQVEVAAEQVAVPLASTQEAAPASTAAFARGQSAFAVQSDLEATGLAELPRLSAEESRPPQAAQDLSEGALASVFSSVTKHKKGRFQVVSEQQNAPDTSSTLQAQPTQPPQPAQPSQPTTGPGEGATPPTAAPSLDPPTQAPSVALTEAEDAPVQGGVGVTQAQVPAQVQVLAQPDSLASAPGTPTMSPLGPLVAHLLTQAAEQRASLERLMDLVSKESVKASRTVEEAARQERAYKSTIATLQSEMEVLEAALVRERERSCALEAQVLRLTKSVVL